MVYKDFFRGYTALNKLSKMDFNVRDAYSIYKIKKEIDNIYTFGIERQRELINKYDGQLKSDGMIDFIHGEDKQSREVGLENMRNYIKESDELEAMEISEEITPIVLKYDSFGDQKITPEDMAALDGFVVFE